MNEINLIDLYIAFGLIIIRLEKLLSLNLFFFLLCCPFLFWVYFILQGFTPSAFVDQVWIDDKRKTGFQQRLTNTINYK